MLLKSLYVFFLAVGLFTFLLPVKGAEIIEKDDKTYIVDRHNEEWDISDAVTIGFKPGNFQYGIGRHAITPLDDSSLSVDHADVSPNERIIAIEEANDGKAFTVRKLQKHEVSNSWQNDAPVTVAY
jgi:homospermidine synthase